MRLTDASVAIRPRNPWEAIDLGVLLAREHRALLMGSWAIVTLPIFALLSLLLWDYPSLAVLLFWWLKPAFERLPLLILSQALFGNTPSLKQALKAWPRALKPQLLASLTWRRFSLSRSFKLPVQQLEGLSGPARAQRISVLSHKNLRAARCLTSMGSSLEMCLWLGSMALFYMLIPLQVEMDWSWRSLLDIEGDWNWLEHLTNALYALVLVFWGPIYVACGFTLYLNRRTALEAWDIELVLRRLRQRLTGSAYALVIGCALILSSMAPPAWASQPLSVDQNYSCPLPPLDQPVLDLPEADPPSARLTQQPLTSTMAQNEIRSVLRQPPFRNPKMESGWRFAEEKTGETKKAAVEKPGALLKFLNALFHFAKMLGEVFKVLMWALALVLVCLVVWRYRAWLRTFVDRRAPVEKIRHDLPEQLFGLQLSAQSLPDDVAASAETLWATQPREALGLLYRALLSKLMSDYKVPLGNADTEGQVLERVARLKLQALNEFSQNLTTHWQNLAYGHRLPPAAAQQQLCDGWRRLFDAGGHS